MPLVLQLAFIAYCNSLPDQLHFSKVWRGNMDHNTYFLTAAVPLPLCPWVQEMCCSGSGSSGCRWDGCVSVCPSLAAFLSAAGIGAAAVLRFSESLLQEGIHDTGDKLSTNDPKLHAFWERCVSWRDALAETAATGLQSPLDAVVMCMLLTGYHLKMRAQFSEWHVFLFWWGNVTKGEFAWCFSLL